jgi:hypothetical protein
METVDSATYEILPNDMCFGAELCLIFNLTLSHLN